MNDPGLPGAGEGTTILVVDDTPDSLVLLSSLLKDEFRVRVANTGEKALRLAATAPPPDLILLDIVMPGMDGYEVCRRLKEDPATRAIPVLFLTSRSEIEDEKRGLELGAADYVTKPISPPLLLARIRNQIRLKALDDFLRDQEEFLEREVARRTRLEVARLLGRAPGPQEPNRAPRRPAPGA